MPLGKSQAISHWDFYGSKHFFYFTTRASHLPVSSHSPDRGLPMFTLVVRCCSWAHIIPTEMCQRVPAVTSWRSQLPRDGHDPQSFSLLQNFPSIKCYRCRREGAFWIGTWNITEEWVCRQHPKTHSFVWLFHLWGPFQLIVPRQRHRGRLQSCQSVD